jgi:hypothetical protein
VVASETQAEEGNGARAILHSDQRPEGEIRNKGREGINQTREDDSLIDHMRNKGRVKEV